MSDEIEDRADALDARIDAVGGPDAIVKSLVTGFARQRRVVKWVIVGLVLDVILSIALSIVVYVTDRNTSRVQANSKAIAENLHAQQLAVWVQCGKSKINTTKINTTDNAFIAFLDGLPKNPTPESQARLDAFVKIYRGALLDVPECGPMP